MPVFFDQPFVFCSICHKKPTREDPLSLTSCAHILCSQHTPPISNFSTNTCSFCNSNNISLIRLNDTDNESLPPDITPYFQPLPNHLENLYNISQFQFNNMKNQIQYYQEVILKLRERSARQRQLLTQAKVELDSIPKLKTNINELKEKLREKDLQLNSLAFNSNSTSDSLSGSSTPGINSKNKFFKNGFPNQSNHNTRNIQSKLSAPRARSVFSFDLKNNRRSDFTNNNENCRPPLTVDLTLDDDSISDKKNNIERNFFNKYNHTPNNNENSNNSLGNNIDGKLLSKEYITDPNSTNNILSESTQIMKQSNIPRVQKNSTIYNNFSPHRTSVSSVLQNQEMPSRLKNLKFRKRSTTVTDSFNGKTQSQIPTQNRISTASSYNHYKGLIDHMRSSSRRLSNVNNNMLKKTQSVQK